MKNRLSYVLAFAALLLVARPAAAHFPWMTINADGKAAFFFGENVADRTYHLPESIAKAEIQVVAKSGKAKPVKVEQVDSDDFVGLVSAKKVKPNATLTSQVTYGAYRGSRLDYYTIHQGGPMPKSLDAYRPDKLPLALQAKVIDAGKAGVDVYVSYQGKPLTGAEVRLYCDEGHEEGTAKTDENGKVSFNDNEVEGGLNGIMVGLTNKDESGDLNGQKYQGASHYLTVTFFDPDDSAPKP